MEKGIIACVFLSMTFWRVSIVNLSYRPHRWNFLPSSMAPLSLVSSAEIGLFEQKERLTPKAMKLQDSIIP